MAHGNVDEYVFSEGTAAGGDSDEEIEVTAAEVLAQLEEVRRSIIINIRVY